MPAAPIIPAMRLMTWNCGAGGFRRKVAHIIPFRPDVLTVQEVSAADHVPTLAGETQPTFRDQTIDPEWPGSRAIGVFSYTGTRIVQVDLLDANYTFRRFEAQCGNLTFNVAAVWNAYRKLREDTYMQAIQGVRCHKEWMRQRPTVMLGDFNDNARYKLTNWPQLDSLISPLPLVSAYHVSYFNEQPGKETRPTYFHKRQKTSAFFHVDYCFIPAEWVSCIQKVEVGSYDDWHTLSDHVPLIVDLDLPMQAKG